MNKTFKIILIFILIFILFYIFFSKKEIKEIFKEKPKVAIIFDDLGESLKELKEINSLGIPLTVSIIPGLKFSKNIGYIAYRLGFSVLVHLPFQPKNDKKYLTTKYEFISSNLSSEKLNHLLNYYLNYFNFAIGINNHMGSKATEEKELMSKVLDVIKKKKLIFIDSRTSSKSVAYKLAKEKNLICGYNEGFFDITFDTKTMEKFFGKLIERAKKKKKIIIIAHPKKTTIEFLRKKIQELKEEIEFINLKDYFKL
ncbi:MAG: divergent polysaccharide deacetylase family protein [Candidatus Aenigmatarchaeota archaeon]